MSKLIKIELFLTVLVILGGAVVRATGSGAGCGEHWPLCNGQTIPISPKIETIIEFSHRLTSGLSLLFFVFLYFFVRKQSKKGDAIRSWSNVALVSFVLEAAIGAVLVLKSLVATDTSYLRAFVIAGHLINTLVLLAGLTAMASNTEVKPFEIPVKWRWLALGWITVGAMGAIVALGDTLFPATSIGHGIGQELAAGAHPLVRLRVFHPLVAMIVSAITYSMATKSGLKTMIIAQVCLGLLNWILLAPLALQVMHLLFADVTWMFFILQCLSSSEKATKNVTPVSLVHSLQPR